MTPPAHKLPAISLRWKGGRIAVPAIALAPGEILAVTGPSGAGKSLWLNALMGWRGQQRRGRPYSAEATLMIQDPGMGLTPARAIGGHFREVVAARPWRPRALDLLAALGLERSPRLLRSMPHTLSGGARQRVLLALALASRPSVVLCDEPAASLDPDNEDRLWALLTGPARQPGLTLVFITHRLDLIEAHAHRVLGIDKGQPFFWGTADAFFAEPETDIHRRLLHTWRQVTDRRDPDPGSTGQDGPTAAELTGLRLSFGDKPVFEDFSWRIGAGSWWWLSGPSGSGKTCLGKALAGLVVPERAQLTLAGMAQPLPLRQRDPDQRTAVVYLFQFASTAFNPALTVARQLARVFADRRAWRDELLELFGLADLSLDRLPRQYSLGELQRLNLVRALAVSPSVLICDELTAPLDWVLRHQIVAALAEVQRRTGLAVVMIAHDPLLPRLKPGRHLRLTGHGNVSV